jgi:hypothetical protein
MSFVIGFGDVEKRYEENLESKIRDYVAEQYSERGDCYFADDFTKEIGKWANGLAMESQEIGEQYKKSETYPDHYSYFWCNTLGDASHIVFIISIHHINRRHGLSPDGWALMKTERVFCVKEWDAGEAKRAKDAAA